MTLGLGKSFCGKLGISLAEKGRQGGMGDAEAKQFSIMGLLIHAEFQKEPFPSSFQRRMWPKF
jgi:hypothetical protein